MMSEEISNSKKKRIFKFDSKDEELKMVIEMFSKNLNCISKAHVVIASSRTFSLPDFFFISKL